jgi:hypothetical protein
MKRVGKLSRRDEVDVRVDPAGGQDATFAGDDLGGSADDQAGRDAVHDAGIAGLADRGDAAVAHADVRLVNPGGIDDNSIGDDEVGRASGSRHSR